VNKLAHIKKGDRPSCRFLCLMIFTDYKRAVAGGLPVPRLSLTCPQPVPTPKTKKANPVELA
jgi:hypothetical protein